MRSGSKSRCEDGMILVISLVLLLVASTMWMTLSSLTFNKVIQVHRMLKVVSDFYDTRLDLQNLFTIAVDVLSKESDWEGDEVSGSLREFLDSWERFVERNYPSVEAEAWLNLASSLDVGKFLDVSYEASRLSEVFRNLEDYEAAVFRKETEQITLELLIVRIGDNFAWGIIPKEKYTPLNRYMFFTNTQGEIYFVTGDVIRGPLIINDTLYIWGDPVFEGDVVVRDVVIRDGSPTFQNGITIIDENYDVFELNEEYADDVIENYRNLTEDVTRIRSGYSGGLFFDRNTLSSSGIRNPREIVITGDVEDDTAILNFYIRSRGRYYKYYSLEYDLSSTPKAYQAVLKRYDRYGNLITQFDITFNGVILIEDNLKVTVSYPTVNSYFSGLLTIASAGTLYIGGNIVYGFLKEDGSFETNTASYNEIAREHAFDFLNLVARDDVIIDRDVPNNLYITASIYGLNGMFTLEDYDRVRKDTLHVFGSIVQRERGPMGTFTTTWKRTRCCSTWESEGCCGEGEVMVCFFFFCCCYVKEVVSISGFSKDYTYDERLFNPLIRPLGNPMIVEEGAGGSEGQISIIDLR